MDLSACEIHTHTHTHTEQRTRPLCGLPFPFTRAELAPVPGSRYQKPWPPVGQPEKSQPSRPQSLSPPPCRANAQRHTSVAPEPDACGLTATLPGGTHTRPVPVRAQTDYQGYAIRTKCPKRVCALVDTAIVRHSAVAQHQVGSPVLGANTSKARHADRDRLQPLTSFGGSVPLASVQNENEAASRNGAEAPRCDQSQAPIDPATCTQVALTAAVISVQPSIHRGTHEAQPCFERASTSKRAQARHWGVGLALSL